MAKKTKAKTKSKKAAARPARAHKSSRLKVKAAKPARKTVPKKARASQASRPSKRVKQAKPARPSKAARASKSARPAKVSSKIKVRKAKAPHVAARKPSADKRLPAVREKIPIERTHSKRFASAVQAYELGLKLMHAEQYEKAKRCFEKLVHDHPDEPEIQERAKVLIHACELKKQEHGRTVLRSADDHYNVGIAELNRRELGPAIQHLQQALKLTPKADHVLYALAAANALQGNRDETLMYLKQAIHHRAENRFLAARDTDFAALADDSDFKQLVTPIERPER